MQWKIKTILRSSSCKGLSLLTILSLQPIKTRSLNKLKHQVINIKTKTIKLINNLNITKPSSISLVSCLMLINMLKWTCISQPNSKSQWITIKHSQTYKPMLPLLSINITISSNNTCLLIKSCISNTINSSNIINSLQPSSNNLSILDLNLNSNLPCLLLACPSWCKCLSKIGWWICSNSISNTLRGLSSNQICNRSWTSVICLIHID